MHVHLPRRRHVSPWSSRWLVVASVVVAIVLMPLWLDPSLVGQLTGITPTPVPSAGSLPPANPAQASLQPSAAARLLARDSFSRDVGDGWGSADSGGSYEAHGQAVRLRVDGGAGVAVAGDTPAWVLLPAATGRDVAIDVRVTLPALPAGGALAIHVIGRSSDAGRYYQATLHVAAGGAVSATVERVVDGTTVAVDGPVAVLNVDGSAGAGIELHVELSGSDPTTVSLRAWRAGEPEPAVWDIRATDYAGDLQQAGAIGLGWQLTGDGSGATAEVQFDDLAATVSDTGTVP